MIHCDIIVTVRVRAAMKRLPGRLPMALTRSLWSVISLAERVSTVAASRQRPLCRSAEVAVTVREAFDYGVSTSGLTSTMRRRVPVAMPW